MNKLIEVFISEIEEGSARINAEYKDYSISCDVDFEKEIEEEKEIEIGIMKNSYAISDISFWFIEVVNDGGKITLNDFELDAFRYDAKCKLEEQLNN